MNIIIVLILSVIFHNKALAQNASVYLGDSIFPAGVDWTGIFSL